MYSSVWVQRVAYKRAHAYSGLGCIRELNIECRTGFIAVGRPLIGILRTVLLG